MRLDEVANLDDGRLHLLVIGPRFGESLLLRAPSGRWLAVDSLARLGEGRYPPLEALAKLRGVPWALALSHPHLDHAAGFARLVDASPGGVLGAGPEFVAGIDGDIGTGSLRKSLHGRQVRTAYRRIRDAWREGTHDRWELREGEAVDLDPDVRVVVLYPPEDLDVNTISDPNEASAPLLVLWRDVRLLLGADLPKPGWRRFAADSPLSVERCAAVKIPHHAAQGSIDDAWTAPHERDAALALTPYQLGGSLVPRFEDGEGVNDLLDLFDRLLMTAPPFELARPAAADLTRAQLRDRVVVQDGELILEDDDPVELNFDLLDAWLLISIDDQADVQLRRGPSSVAVT